LNKVKGKSKFKNKEKTKPDKKEGNKMRLKANQEIRNACQNSNVTLWMLAERLSIADSTLSKQLRRELPTKRKQEILEVIRMLAEEMAVTGDDE
jgi:DNA-binding transcriptional regulator YiaG